MAARCSGRMWIWLHPVSPALPSPTAGLYGNRHKYYSEHSFTFICLVFQAAEFKKIEEKEKEKKEKKKKEKQQLFLACKTFTGKLSCTVILQNLLVTFWIHLIECCHEKRSTALMAVVTFLREIVKSTLRLYSEA